MVEDGYYDESEEGAPTGPEEGWQGGILEDEEAAPEVQGEEADDSQEGDAVPEFPEHPFSYTGAFTFPRACRIQGQEARLATEAS